LDTNSFCLSSSSSKLNIDSSAQKMCILPEPPRPAPVILFDELDVELAIDRAGFDADTELLVDAFLSIFCGVVVAGEVDEAEGLIELFLVISFLCDEIVVELADLLGFRLLLVILVIDRRTLPTPPRPA